jgi:curved DNA-binding protein CbpA
VKDLYETLGVNKDASPPEIKKAHRKRVAKAHPDKGGSKDEFLAVQLAYEVLSDEARRQRYDSTGQTSEPRGDQITSRLAALVAQTVFICDEKHENVLAAVRRKIESEIRAARAGIKEQRKKADRLRSAADRISIKSKGEPNLLSTTLNQQAEEFERLASINEDGVSEAEQMLEILNSYEYRTDKREGDFYPYHNPLMSEFFNTR